MNSDIQALLVGKEAPTLKFIGIIFSFVGLTLIGGCVAVFVLLGSNIQHIFDPAHLEEWLPHTIVSGIAAIFVCVGIITLRLSHKKRQVIQDILENGTQEQAQVISNHQNFSYLVNGVPQSVVKFKTHSGRELDYRFFNESLAQCFPVGLHMMIRHKQGDRALPDPDALAQLLT